MSKVIPVRAVEGRHTPAGAIELRFTALDGKPVTIAFMPSYADKVCGVLQRLRGEPDTTAVEVLPPAAWTSLRSLAAGEPLRSGGLRVAADAEKKIVHLQVAQPDGVSAEVRLPEDSAARLVQHLGNALAAIRPPAGSA